MNPIRVLIIDDSAVMRQLLRAVLSQAPGLEVVGAARDAATGWDAIQKHRPDVVTLDVEMPGVDGLTFLERVMREAPLPVVMVSALTDTGASATLRALELGAVDFVGKPVLDHASGTLAVADEIVAKVRAAAAARPRRGAAIARTEPAVAASGLRARAGGFDPRKVILIGASTGGTEALRDVLAAMPANAPGVLIVQHMPEHFTRKFAARLDAVTPMTVREARDGDVVAPGVVLLAPGGDCHMQVVARANGLTIKVAPGDPVNHHRPSVDVLFQSAASALGARAIAGILTGMGGDGARGMLALRRAGAHTVAQDAASSVVFGMAKEAIAAGGVEQVVPLERVATALLGFAARAA